jgi:hypothetical protein
MPEPVDSPKHEKPKSKRDGGGEGASRNLSARVERSLKDVDRLITKNPGSPPYEKAMAQLERAKISALLQLAEAIRESRRAGKSPLG